ncbi:MAG: SufD family Fe-S cluster assembly protein [Pseudomonadota bacterium]
MASKLTNEELVILHDVGYGDDVHRAATAVIRDGNSLLAQSRDPDVIIMPLADALREIEFVQDLMFGLVAPDANDDIAMVAEHMHDPLGHFIWVKPGAKVRLPVQTFSLVETPQSRQFTHDVTLIDEGAEVELISGSAVPRRVHRGHHISIDEIYLRPNAKCRTVSIDHWGEAMETHSYGYTRLEEGAYSQSTTIKLSPVGQDTSRCETVLHDASTAISQTLIFAPEGTERVLETETRLLGGGAKSEDVTRMVAAGGRIVNDAKLIGEASGATGFLGCDGLKLTEIGEISATPALVAQAENAHLSHEASVGMIDSEKLNYLMAMGIDEDASRDLIIQGFLSLSDSSLPMGLRAKIVELISQAKSGGM